MKKRDDHTKDDCALLGWQLIHVLIKADEIAKGGPSKWAISEFEFDGVEFEIAVRTKGTLLQ